MSGPKIGRHWLPALPGIGSRNLTPKNSGRLGQLRNGLNRLQLHIGIYQIAV
jgi:hypothetical protein